ncbi:hypothetical protein ACFLYH_00460 [Candidatus Dependentiae bacterium]
MYKKLTFIVYDGIQNSVFSSQVLRPLLNLLKKNNKLKINLISFEKEKISNTILLNLIPTHNRLNFILCKKLPFFGKLSLRFAVYQLKKIFKKIQSDEIITRGPLAGWITIKALTKKSGVSPKIILQARGLCAQEYRFVCQYKKENFINKWARKIIVQKLHQIELEAYNKNNNLKFDFYIESVSPALKNYLMINFGAKSSKITIAKDDIPKKLSQKDIEFFRKKIRENLKISDDTKVYCYSGSYKVWQCLPNIVDYFSEKIKKDKKKFLLILSSDKIDIENLIKDKNIEKNKYKILCVKASELHKFLAACDVGFLFRDKDIINWVSRPTKMLEYQSVGLEIVHNNTIGCLENGHF